MRITEKESTQNILEKQLGVQPREERSMEIEDLQRELAEIGLAGGQK